MCSTPNRIDDRALLYLHRQNQNQNRLSMSSSEEDPIDNEEPKGHFIGQPSKATSPNRERVRRERIRYYEVFSPSLTNLTPTATLSNAHHAYH